MYAQIIDDETGRTLVSVFLEGQEGRWRSEDRPGQDRGRGHRREGEGGRASRRSFSTATDTSTMAV
jgi:hypothetical protein